MKRTQILTELFQSKELAALIAKMQPEDLQDDIKQELFVTLCEMPEEKLIELHDRKQLRFYAVRTVLNMVQSSKSRFFYKFRKNVTLELKDYTAIADTIENTNDSKDYQPLRSRDLFSEDVDINEYERVYAEKIIKLNKAYEELGWYQRQILDLYLELGSVDKVVADFKKHIGKSIPRSSIFDTLKKTNEELRQKASEDNMIVGLDDIHLHETTLKMAEMVKRKKDAA